MEKYIQHGLTRLEDNLLGAFSMDPKNDEIELNMFTLEHRQAFNSLVRKGLLERRIQKDETIKYVPTPKGKKLWRIRAKEEEESPIPPGVRSRLSTTKR